MKTDHMDIFEQRLDLNVRYRIIKILTNTDTSKSNISNKIAQAEQVIKNLNTIMWNAKTSGETKSMIQHAILEKSLGKFTE